MFFWWSGQRSKLHIHPYEGCSLPLKIPDPRYYIAIEQMTFDPSPMLTPIVPDLHGESRGTYKINLPRRASHLLNSNIQHYT